MMRGTQHRTSYRAQYQHSAWSWRTINYPSSRQIVICSFCFLGRNACVIYAISYFPPLHASQPANLSASGLLIHIIRSPPTLCMISCRIFLSPNTYLEQKIIRYIIVKNSFPREMYLTFESFFLTLSEMNNN